MSEEIKDLRGTLKAEGPEALREAVENAEPWEDADTAPKIESFPITRADAMEASEGARDFVEGLLTEGGASVTYGASNSGKTFWLLNLGAHIATGKAWRHGEVEIDQGAVVYVCLEGTHGMQNRIEAMKRAGILTPGAPFYVCTSPVSLLDATHADKLAETVREAARQSELPCRLVIIDTMARAMAGGDENSGKDMTFAVASIDAVKQATGAHVAIVHHCGKDEARGARGHSSLRAAVDTEIEVSKPEGDRITTVRVTKQRDLERGEAMPFSLKVIELGTNRRGKVITSCIVHHEDEMMASKPKTAGRKPTYSPESLLDYLPADSVSDWQTRASEDSGISRSLFYELKNTLKASGGFRSEVGTGRLVKA